MQKIRSLLESGLQYQGIELNDLQINQLLDYVDLLEKWNKVYNLTSIKNKQQMIILHLLDSLSILTKIKSLSCLYTQPVSIADVGTGGGLPGIPLAICFPDIEFSLIDAREKKIRFLKQVIQSIGLNNVKALHIRVEDYDPALKFDLLVTRAFSSIADMLGICSHLCHPTGLFLAMKGKQPLAEIKQLPAGYKIQSIQALNIYQLDAQRHLLIIKKN